MSPSLILVGGRIAAHRHRGIEIFGDKGMALAENPRPVEVVRADAQGFRSATLHSFFVERYAASHQRELEAFVQCVEEDLPVPVTGEDARAPVAIGLAARRSLASGCLVSL